MNQILKILFSLSFSGTLMMLILLCFIPYMNKQFSKRWQYYIWLLVIARLLIPFAPEKNLTNMLAQQVSQKTQFESIGGSAKNSQSVIDPKVEKNINEVTVNTHTVDLNQIIATVIDYLWLIWIGIAAGNMIRKITIYQSFVKYIKAGWKPIEDMALLERYSEIKEKMNVRKNIDVYDNPLISSPLLVGFIKPRIVLPTCEMSESDFEYTILHELTHYKRRDMFYKWLVQLTIALHWFNPFVYLMGKEMNRMCELSCDEAVIRRLDVMEHRVYGEALLHGIQIGGKYRESIASVTLCDSKALLKERLEAIMQYKKRSQLSRVLSMLCIVLIMVTGAYMGSYRGSYAATKETLNPKSKTVGKGNDALNTDIDELNEDSKNIDNEDDELEELAEEYFKNGNVVYFPDIFLELSEELQLSYCKRMVEERKNALVGSLVEEIRVEQVDAIAQIAYDKKEIATFSVAVPYISEKVRKELIVKASKEKQNSFLSELTNNEREKE